MKADAHDFADCQPVQDDGEEAEEIELSDDALEANLEAELGGAAEVDPYDRISSRASQQAHSGRSGAAENAEASTGPEEVSETFWLCALQHP